LAGFFQSSRLKEGETMKVVPLHGYSLEKGIRLFNEGKYFAAHEVWESPLFRAQNAQHRHFLQGLMMAAGAFSHAQNRECGGAVTLLAKSIPLLKDGVDTHPDLRVSDFITALERLGSRKDWCPTAATTQTQLLPRITGSISLL